MDLIAHSLYFD